MKPRKAIVTDVSIGHLTIKGLKLPCGKYAVAATQANEILSFAAQPGDSARNLKRLMGEGFQPSRIATELNSNKALILQLDELVLLVKKLARTGNEKAFDFLEIMAGLSLEQLFADAFGDRFEKEERQESLRIRQKGKIGRRSVTDSIMEWYLEKFGYKPEGDVYRKFTNDTKKLLGFPLEKNHREICLERGDNEALELYDFCERVVASYIEGQKLSPTEALELFAEHHPNKCNPLPAKFDWGPLNLALLK